MSLYTDFIVENTVIFGKNAIVFDIGGNFKSICERLDGEYVNLYNYTDVYAKDLYKETEKIETFDLKIREEISEVMRFILQGIVLAKLNLKWNRASYIDQAIDCSLENNNTIISLEKIIEFLTGHKKRIVREMGEVISAFSSNGSIAYLFNRIMSINFQNRLVVIEMADLRHYPMLLDSILKLMINQINRITQAEHHKPYLILMHEVWMFLEGKDRSIAISEAAEFVNQKGGGLLLGTYNLVDSFDSKFKTGMCGDNVNPIWRSCVVDAQLEEFLRRSI